MSAVEVYKLVFWNRNACIGPIDVNLDYLRRKSEENKGDVIISYLTKGCLQCWEHGDEILNQYQHCLIIIKTGLVTWHKTLAFQMTVLSNSFVFDVITVLRFLIKSLLFLLFALSILSYFRILFVCLFVFLFWTTSWCLGTGMLALRWSKIDVNLCNLKFKLKYWIGRSIKYEEEYLSSNLLICCKCTSH